MNDEKHQNFKELINDDYFLNSFINEIWKHFLKGYCIYNKTRNYREGIQHLKNTLFLDWFVERSDKLTLYRNLTGVPLSHKNGTNNSNILLDYKYENSAFLQQPFLPFL